jgi:hypothetical protein
MQVNMRSSELTVILIALYLIIAIPAVLVATIMISSLVSGGWSIALAILTFLIAAGAALQGYQALRLKRQVADLRVLWPDYSGERIPIFDLLMLRDAEGEYRRGENDRHVYSLGDTGDGLVLFRHRTGSDLHKLPAGPLVFRGGKPFRVAKRDIAEISLNERSDREMAESAIDRRDYGERLGSALAQMALSTRVKTKIVPYAAYLQIVASGDEGPIEVLSAVPSEVGDELLESLGSGVIVKNDKGNWLVDEALGKAKGLAADEAHELATAIAGDAAVELFDSANELVGGVAWLGSPDQAVIGTTKGARARLAARLVALKLRGSLPATA